MKMNKEWMKKKGLDKWFQRDNLIILVLSGVLLFIITLPTKDDSNTVEKTAEKGSGGSLRQTEEVQVEMGTEGEADYAAYLEERLETMLSGVSGVGKVEVMVTLQSSEELVLEKDEPIIQSNIQETDSQGGSRITSQMETKETTIYSTEGSNSEPYVIKRLLPEIEGVLVVAQGAGNGNINKDITEIVQALFDIEAHKIMVVKMQASK